MDEIIAGYRRLLGRAIHHAATMSSGIAIPHARNPAAAIAPIQHAKVIPARSHSSFGNYHLDGSASWPGYASEIRLERALKYQLR